MCQQDRTQLNVAKAKEFMGRLPAKEVKVQSKVGLFDKRAAIYSFDFLNFFVLNFVYKSALRWRNCATILGLIHITERNTKNVLHG